MTSGKTNYLQRSCGFASMPSRKTQTADKGAQHGKSIRKQKEKCRCAPVLFYLDCGHYERLSDRGSERKPDSRICCTGMPAFVAPGDCSDVCLF